MDRYLIVNADGFGRSWGVNQGVIRAHEDGIVTSASLMVRWMPAVEAAAYAARAPALSVGLHLDLGEWILRDDRRIKSYEFVPDEPDRLREELLRQLELFRRLTGKDPSHIDSHQHFHRSAAFASIVIELGQNLRIPVRMMSSVRYRGEFWDGTRVEKPVVAEQIIESLRSLPIGLNELSCHPGEDVDLLPGFAEERREELGLLCDSRVRKAILEEKIQLISFADLPPVENAPQVEVASSEVPQITLSKVAIAEDIWTLSLDYPIRPRPRYGYGRPHHYRLNQLIEQRRPDYRLFLERAANLRESLLRIPRDGEPDAEDPTWLNGWFPPLDAMSLYTLLCELNPAMYVEVGSGASTKFARRAIGDHDLKTRIISIDPNPRHGIDRLCDQVIRRPLEYADLNIFQTLRRGDVVLFDGSHRTFTNSDATVEFLDVLPELRPGVHVGVHDVFLPADYPPDWSDRFYSEQYLLATYLLAGSSAKVMFPSWYVHNDPELAAIVNSIWDEIGLEGDSQYSSLFWLRIE